MWDVRGWKRLTVHDDPPLLLARHELLSWLATVPEPLQAIWTGRLKSDMDHPHFSVRLELYLYHYFTSNGWDVEIEPNMSGTLNKPDFLVSRGEDRLLVEAKVVLDEQSTAQQTQRLRRLADDLADRLSRTISIQPLSILPPSLPAKRIRHLIEQRAETQAGEILEFDLSDKHQGMPYTLKVVIFPGGPDRGEPGSVAGTISAAFTVTVVRRIRDALEQKAGKYGVVDTPFIIGLDVETLSPAQCNDEIDALFGDREWLVPMSGMGRVTQRRLPNGFFTSVLEGEHHHIDVSAVIFYRFKWVENTHVHLAHIYHNPFALRPLSPDLFPGVPQMVQGDEGTMKWINGEPE